MSHIVSEGLIESGKVFFAHNCTFFCATINTNRFNAIKKVRSVMAKKLKKLSDCLSDILNLKVIDDENKEFLNSLGIKKGSADNKMLIMARLFDRASSGDISAIKEIRSIMADTESKDYGKLKEIIEAIKNVK